METPLQMLLSKVLIPQLGKFKEYNNLFSFFRIIKKSYFFAIFEPLKRF